MGSSSALIESPASWWDSLAENFLPYLTIYAEEWDSLVEEFLRHLAMTCFAVVLASSLPSPWVSSSPEAKRSPAWSSASPM